MIPSNRIWKRTSFDGEFYHLNYGTITIRVRPSLWLVVPNEPLEIGDRVELMSQGGIHDPCVAEVVEKTWNVPRAMVLYGVRVREYILPKTFTLHDLRPIHAKVQLLPSPFDHPPPKYIRGFHEELPFPDESL